MQVEDRVEGGVRVAIHYDAGMYDGWCALSVTAFWARSKIAARDAYCAQRPPAAWSSALWRCSVAGSRLSRVSGCGPNTRPVRKDVRHRRIGPSMRRRAQRVDVPTSETSPNGFIERNFIR